MLENLEKILKDKEVLITNTYVVGSVGYELAHLIRNYARVTYCVDDRYLMKNEPQGFRIIESGKVVLIKGNLENKKAGVYDIIRSLRGKVDYKIEIK